MNNTTKYLELIEGPWNSGGLIFDFKTIADLDTNRERIEIIVTGFLPPSTSKWLGYLKSDKGRMLFIHSNEQFTDRIAEILKLNGEAMVWKIISEGFSEGQTVTFFKI